MLTIKHLYKFCDFIKDSNWIEDYNFWLLGSFPKVVNGELPEVRDIDIAIVNKHDCHNKKEITAIIYECKKCIENTDIYYRPNLNKDLQERGLDTIWTSNQFWGDKETWPTKQNYQAWRVKRYRPLELWYLVENKLNITYKLWPNEKHVERVIDGLDYAKPILLNNYIKEEKYNDSTS
tara:strand:+ start:124 stop:657 length:534 start_codon:yes stop_codon:yes gene_type:complete